MATIENTYTGNGSRTDYDFTFEYLKQADVKVEIDNVAETGFTFLNATELRFNTAPANNTTVRIYRDTNVDTLQAEFFPGSSIKAEDLNNNFTQNNFATQESKLQSAKAPQALTNSQTAISTANTAASDAAAALTAVNNVVAASAAATEAALPSSPSTGSYVDLFDSTNLSITVNNLPAGFTGSSDVTLRLQWNGTAWDFVSYTPTDPDTRYYTQTAANAAFLEPADIGVTIQGYDADIAKLDAVQTFTTTQTFSGMAVFQGIAAFGSSSIVSFNNDVDFSSTQTFPNTPLLAVNANRTLIAQDAGKTLVRTAGNITFPANGPTAGDLITIYNDGSTDCNLTRDPGSSTVLQPILLKAGSTTTKDFVLKPGGIVTVLCLAESNGLTSAAKYVISGSGVL